MPVEPDPAAVAGQENIRHCKPKEENLYCPQSLTRQPQSARERIQHYRPDH